MYKVIKEVPKRWNENLRGKALLALEDEYGGQSVIAMDDHCYVLYNGSEDRKFRPTTHWYKEAAEAFRDYLN